MSRSDETLGRLDTSWKLWVAWIQRSNNRRIFSATITVGAITSIVSLALLSRELVVANEFGISNELDAFLMALLLPTLAVNVVAGSFDAALIPTYMRIRERDGLEKADALFSGAMVLGLASLVVAAALLAFAFHFFLPVIASGFSPEKREMTEAMFFLLLPMIVVGGAAGLWSARLNAGEEFAVASMSPILVPVTSVGFIILLGENWGLFALASGTVVGTTLQCAVLIYALKRNRSLIWPKWSGMTIELREVVARYAPLSLGALLTASTAIVDRSMAATLGAGSVAALNYGNKVVAFLLAIGASALSKAVLPHFARMSAENDWSGIRHTLRTYTRLILVVAVPLTLLIVVLSPAIVEAVFERGAFTQADTQVVTGVQSFYALQIPFYLLGAVVGRLLSVLTNNRVFINISAVVVVANITLNYLLIQIFGVSGIALSTTLVAAISVGMMTILVRARLRAERVQ